MVPQFVHLTAKTNFSLLESMVQPKKLAKALAGEGFAACGVTEIGNLFSSVEASKALTGAGIQPILGSELPVHTNPGMLAYPQVAYLTLLVTNATGWRNLAKLTSMANLNKLEPHGLAFVSLQDVLARNEGLICLTGPYTRGCADMWLRHQGAAGLRSNTEALLGAFGDRLYVQLERHGVDGEAATEQALLSLAEALDVPLVATNDVRFVKKSDQTACEVLMGIGDSTTQDDPQRRRLTPNHSLRSAADMLAAFADIPSACENTVHIAQRCAFALEAISVKNMFMPVWEFDPGVATPDVIRREAEAGLEERLHDFVYPRFETQEQRDAERVRYYKQLDYELNVIIGMGFDGYFLITSDFIRWAKRQGIPVGPGRGSGAGSLVAWALSITDLDPIRWQLYFERFLNPDRVSLPDFDVDFCQDRREEVIAYVRERFGSHRVSSIITFGTLKARACLRDVGRVLGLGYGFVGEIAKFVPEVPNPPPIADVLATDERLRARYEEEDDVRRLIDTAKELEGCYRHASTHAAGVIIADRDIAEVCGLYIDPRSPMPITQLSMKDVEYCGLVKFDFLGLKTLSVIRMAEEFVRVHTPGFDVNRVSLNDARTFDMLKTGATFGVFQIESAGMTDLTKKMKADSLESLSDLIALYRPGPMELIPKYLAVRLGREPEDYPHALLESTLKETYGIAVYQEQVMQMARVLAGYTLAAGDMLRRAMGKKDPKEMAKQRSVFVDGCAATNQIAAEDANRVFDLIEVFAGYGFNKAHSMAYGLISYQTAYLKAHYPLEFMAASMTYDRGNTDKLMRYKQELISLGFGLLPPSINQSGVMFTVENTPEGGRVRHALAAVKGAGEGAMRGLVAEREKGGIFADVWDFLARNDTHAINKRQLEVLIKAGAMDCLAKNPDGVRPWLLHNLEQLLAYASANAEQQSSGQADMFGAISGGGDSRLSPEPFKQGLKVPQPWTPLEKLEAEADALGFYISAHPLESFAPDLKGLPGLKPVCEIEQFAAVGGGNCKVAVIAHSIREVKTKTGGRMGIVQVSDPTGQTEVALFTDTYTSLGAQLQTAVAAKQPLVIALRVQTDGERIRVSADALKPLEDFMETRPELTITLEDAAQAPLIQSMVGNCAGGVTKLKLVLPTPQGRAVVRLPRQVTCTPMLLANLRNLSGVVVG